MPLNKMESRGTYSAVQGQKEATLNWLFIDLGIIYSDKRKYAAKFA